MQLFQSQNEPRSRRRLVAAVYFCLTLMPLVQPRLHAAEVARSSGLSEAEAKNWHLLEPLWASPVVYRESVLFIQDGAAPADARLALVPKRIKRIALADGSQIFTADDYTVDAATRRLTLTPTSRIPHLKADELFPPKGSPRSIRSKAGDPARDVLWDEGHWFHDRQVEVTYEAGEAWNGYRPTVAKDSLPRTLRKLQQGEPLVIAVTGDSISMGYNASGFTGAPPAMPPYSQLVADQLRESSRSKITMANRAVDRWRLEQALEDLPKLLESKPNLVIVAYGMNHINSHDPAAFKRMLTTLVDQIHAVDKTIEIILVSPLYGNPERSRMPPEQFPLHRDVLASFVGPGIALCDMTTLWGQLLERKRYVDLTGNGVNHPNDFGHRLYAQAILGLLLEKRPAANRRGE